MGFASLAGGVHLVVGNFTCGSSVVLGETKAYVKTFVGASVVTIERLWLPIWDNLEC